MDTCMIGSLYMPISSKVNCQLAVNNPGWYNINDYTQEVRSYVDI